MESIINYSCGVAGKWVKLGYNWDTSYYTIRSCRSGPAIVLFLTFFFHVVIPPLPLDLFAVLLGVTLRKIECIFTMYTYIFALFIGRVLYIT